MADELKQSHAGLLRLLSNDTEPTKIALPQGAWGDSKNGLSLFLQLPTNIVQVGTTLPAVLLIRNTGQETARYSRSFGYGGHSDICQFQIEHSTGIQPMQINRPEGVRFAGTERVVELEPNHQHRYLVLLNSIFNITVPGVYAVQARKIVADPEGQNAVEIQSGTLQFEILDDPTNSVNGSNQSALRIAPASNQWVAVTSRIPETFLAPSLRVDPLHPAIPRQKNLTATPQVEIRHAPIASDSTPDFPMQRRNWIYAVLTLLPIVGLITWIVWRRNRKAD